MGAGPDVYHPGKSLRRSNYPSWSKAYPAAAGLNPGPGVLVSVTISMALRLLHILLAACVLVATTGWVTVEHLCGGEVASRGHFTAAEPCSHVSPSQPSCPHHPTPLAAGDNEDGGCCDDRATFDKSDDLLDYAPEIALPTQSMSLAADASPGTDAAADPTPAATWAGRHYRPPPLGPATVALRLAHLGEWRC